MWLRPVLDADIENKETVFFFLRKIWKQKHAHEWAYKIAKLLIEEDNSWEVTESWTDKRVTKLLAHGGTTSTLVPPEHKMILAKHGKFHKPDTPLLLATIHGSTEIVREILLRYPQAVEHVDEDGHNILHLAILHRRHKVIDVVEDMEYPLERLRGRVDKSYNTLLHMVGQKVDELKEDVQDPAQELKIDQRLYKRITDLSPILDSMTRNSDQKTPHEVFSETNYELRAQAKNWMSENAKNCSIVAVLIATVAFTSVYTIPGGTRDDGIPVLKDKPTFLLFTFADAISLSSALTSLILFLNIVTSRFQFQDFASSIFKKQYIALTLLIISVTMMMVSFAATLILTISNDTKWTAEMTLYGVTFFPVLVFIFSYVPDYERIIKDLYSSSKKLIKEKVVANFHNFWDYKPQARHPVARSVNLTTRSPV
ncbi:putative ankyrin repeat-containing domain, PGG domain, ankyrin repeat-containing domain superfamily protein [Tanacetum coccineum]